MEQIKQQIARENINFVRFEATDLHGVSRSKTVPVRFFHVSKPLLPNTDYTQMSTYPITTTLQIPYNDLVQYLKGLYHKVQITVEQFCLLLFLLNGDTNSFK